MENEEFNEDDSQSELTLSIIYKASELVKKEVEHIESNEVKSAIVMFVLSHMLGTFIAHLSKLEGSDFTSEEMIEVALKYIRQSSCSCCGEE